MSIVISEAIKSVVKGGRSPGVEAPASHRVPQKGLLNQTSTPVPKEHLENEVRVKQHQVDPKYNPAINY
ncbi:hypothetical protein [Ewingella americana]|uniref:hypothetical protein n=1 Tax=Ewingella americana TaxID=41202 RepID=UPI00112DACC0|nr:hypothetical protein [Ewingella americana]